MIFIFENREREKKQNNIQNETAFRPFGGLTICPFEELRGGGEKKDLRKRGLRVWVRRNDWWQI